MELKQIKELMIAMGKCGTKRLSIKKEGFEIELEQQETIPYALESASYEIAAEHPHPIAIRKGPAPLPKPAEHPIPSPVVKEDRPEAAPGKFITSPMVGTFYASPSPEDPTYVKVGDKVEKNTVVCIIEAMKVMNEIKADASGTVAEIMLESGHPVEFGSKLFKIV